ncbi:MAG: hypothetical protein R6V12_19475 [Candidatus Hydrogenedentota bacterium]
MIPSVNSVCAWRVAQEKARLPEAALEVPVYEAVDQLLDLSSERRNIFGALDELSPAAREHFLTMTANILKSGIVGYELCDTGSQEPEQRYLLARSADDVLPEARAFRDLSRQYKRRLDVQG